MAFTFVTAKRSFHNSTRKRVVIGNQLESYFMQVRPLAVISFAPREYLTSIRLLPVRLTRGEK